MLEIKELSFAYADEKVLQNFSLSVKEKQPLCIFGASGCGKTTLLRLIAGLEKPLSGTISGADDMKISVVFQEDRLLPSLSAIENIAFVSDKKTAAHLLAAADFSEEDMKKRPSALSGGMCRRVALLRAVAFGGEVLILDEPFKGLDSEMKKRLAEIILNADFRFIIFTTHERSEIELLNGEIFEM